MPDPDYEYPDVQLRSNVAYGTTGTANVVEGDETYI